MSARGTGVRCRDILAANSLRLVMQAKEFRQRKGAERQTNRQASRETERENKAGESPNSRQSEQQQRDRAFLSQTYQLLGVLLLTHIRSPLKQSPALLLKRI